MDTPVLVLGMHRSGTSCLAGLCIAAGCRPPGAVVRNWDNPHGHHEATAAVRLAETVLASSGGSWIAPPPRLTWDARHAAQRDMLLAPVDGAPALVKDPRSLLCLPFWLAARPAPRLIGIVRHPLAVARSLRAWRRMALDEGIRLWLAHNRALLACRDGSGCAVLDFDLPPAAFIVAAAAALGSLLGRDIPVDALAGHYHAGDVHHGGQALDPEAEDAVDAAALAEALDLHAALVGAGRAPVAPPFPWRALGALRRALALGDDAGVGDAARAALAAAADASAVLVPIVAELLPTRPALLAPLVAAAAPRLPLALAGLLAGKVALALGDAAAAVGHLARACAVPDPYWEARTLLAQALRRAGRRAEARAALAAIAHQAIHPHQPLAQLAEWALADGDHVAALAGLRAAIATAPPHRRGRLRTRLADLLRAAGDGKGAAAEAERAVVEDPRWARGWLLAARARESAGDRAGALIAVRTALTVDPVSAEARALEARLSASA